MGNGRATSKPVVVAVDDEPFVLEAWSAALDDRYKVEAFAEPFAALRFIESHDFDLALLDVRMPQMDGIALLEQVKRCNPEAEVILVTGHGTIPLAVQAIQRGAYDFLCKPIDDLPAALRRIEAAVERRRLRQLNARLSDQLAAFTPATELVGVSRAIERIRVLIGQIADTSAPVLICGESGTGKELAARALHSASARRGGPFVAINCGAVTETLIDSELFGHERGAFTGATMSHTGLFEAADRGVLFLDEIGDVPAQTQVRLLRAIQEGEVRPVGSTKSRKVDVRVVAATNANLERSIRAGQFREDLFYRISTFRIDMPSLRERPDDVPVIAQHLLAKFAQRYNRELPTFTDEALATLVAYDWPGNVRQLNNALEHAATLCGAGPIDVPHLPAFVTTRARARLRRAANADPEGGPAVTFSEARAQVLQEFERRYLEDLLNATGGNLSEAARRSGVDRTNLRRLVRSYNLRIEEFRCA